MLLSIVCKLDDQQKRKEDDRQNLATGKLRQNQLRCFPNGPPFKFGHGGDRTNKAVEKHKKKGSTKHMHGRGRSICASTPR